MKQFCFRNGSYNRISKLLMIVFILTLCCPFLTRVSAFEEKKRVLFISSYSEEFISIPEQIKGIQSVFNHGNVLLDIEYMDTKRIDTKENRDLFYEMLEYKLGMVPAYDAVLIGDDNALQFMLDRGLSLFGDIPMVFLGINDVNRAVQAHGTGRFTGVIEVAPLKENIEIALRFYPHSQRVIGIVDNSLTGIGDKEQFYAIAKHFPQLAFSDINASELSMSEFATALLSIPEDTIVLFLSFYTDAKGRNITIDQGVEYLKKYVKAPIFRQSIGGVGDGVLGGKMVSFYESGRIAAGMVLDLLSGKRMDEVKLILESPNYYIFDYHLLKEYKIPLGLVPADSILINEPYSFYKENKEIVNTLLAIMATFAVVSFYVFMDNLKYRRTQAQLKESMERLEQANDELTVSEEEIRTQYATIRERIDEIEILNQKFEIAVESTSAAVFELSMDGKDLFLSRSFASIVEEPVFGNLKAKSILRFFDDEKREALLEEFLRYRTGKSDEIDIQLPLKLVSGEEKWVLIKGKEVLDGHGYSKMINGIVLDTTKVKEQEQYIHHLAFHDHLTDLPNRTMFLSYLEGLMNQGIPCAVMLLDLDNFKTVNDTLGHSCGDNLLKEIGVRLCGIPIEHIFVSRFGGDEFLLVFSHYTSSDQIDVCIDALDRVLAEDFSLNGQSVHVQYTVGISCFPEHGDTIGDIVMHADTALYQAKRTGKNKKMFYTPTMKEELHEKAEIEVELRQALSKDGFYLVYQPQVNVRTGEIDGFEALLRMKANNYPPNKFIAVAEEIGLVVDIGRWVTQEVIRQLQEWRDKGSGLKPISINFSTKQLYDAGYGAYLKRLLEENAINPNLIEIEITESILLEKSEESIHFLDELKQLGVMLSLDDFGTGFSSINYLTYIPVDKVKLDKSLCDRFLEIDNSNVMNSLISLAHSLDLKITAEGIEEAQQYWKLLESGCDYIQGYLFSRPLGVKDIEAIYNCNLIHRMKTGTCQ